MKKLLIANRGEIARRIIRTAHRMGIATVAVYADADAQALHVREASVAVALGGNAPADTYLNADKLLAAARASGAEAVHPGYGFLSENADFAQAVADAGLIWVGPSAAAIRALGNKSAAKQLAHRLRLPCLPGYEGEDQSDARFAHEAGRIGYPVMVKAAAGGGGRGMRLVTAPAQLLAALSSARSEAQSGFGSGELLIERALLQPRHVEVQVFADAHGHCIHLGERDCSVQRRHQKIIEEAPSPAISPALRASMGACAVELALAAGYVGAGTVEFLVEAHEHGGEAGEATSVGATAAATGRPEQGSAPSGGSAAHEVASVGASYFLMEMNTRLQVEHPVTEMLTGLDLVEWQLRVAQGEALPLNRAQIGFSGHAVEVRLCAEDEHFAPHAGQVLDFAAPDTTAEGLRMDHALARGAQVPPFYDSMLGKLIAHGASREEAIDKLLDGLAQTRILGLPTNRGFLRAVLAHPRFRSGQALIPFLSEQGNALREALQKEEQAVLVHAALALVLASNSHAGALPSPFERSLRLRHRGRSLALTLREQGQGRFQVALDGQHHQAEVRVVAALPTAVPAATGIAEALLVDVVVDGLRQDVHACALGGGRWQLQVGAVDLWLENASFEPVAQAGTAVNATELRAPFNGRLIRLDVSIGQAVQRGETLAVLESMKLEHALSAPRDGVVAALLSEPGQQVATGQVLLRFESADMAPASAQTA
jgi:3-methylcrotonyl-CoA carboxylase alpha subunit/geranyl-CoA carboxylase alpha subunit